MTKLHKKKLEHAFDQLVEPKPYERVSFELDCIKTTEKYAKRRVRPYRSHGSKVGNGWRYAATGPQEDDF